MSSGSTNSQQPTQTVYFAFLLHNMLTKPNLRFIFKDNREKKGKKAKNKRYLGKYSLDINGQVSMGTSIPPYNTKSQSIRAFLQSNNLRLRCSENTINTTQISSVCLWGLDAEGTLTQTFIYREAFFTQSQTMTLALEHSCRAQSSKAAACAPAPHLEKVILKYYMIPTCLCS